MTLSVTCAFDGGNIIVKNQEDELDIRLDIRKDNASDFFQWFYYRVTGAKGEACRMIIENAKDAAYTGGWENYRACASYDRKTTPAKQWRNGGWTVSFLSLFTAMTRQRKHCVKKRSSLLCQI